jgi:hypothetical protein
VNFADFPLLFGSLFITDNNECGYAGFGPVSSWMGLQNIVGLARPTTGTKNSSAHD